MTRYLISFEDGAMDFPEEDLPEVAEAAQEAKDAGVFVFTGGLDYRAKHAVVATDGMVSVGGRFGLVPPSLVGSVTSWTGAAYQG